MHERGPGSRLRCGILKREHRLHKYQGVADGFGQVGVCVDRQIDAAQYGWLAHD